MLYGGSLLWQAGRFGIRSAFALRIISGIAILDFAFGATAFAEHSAAIKAPVGLLSGRAVCVSRGRGFAPTSSADFPELRILNNSSAEYAQSATTTTAASGGNREELLGQRPARRACRPRHDADAGCRNPEEAEAIPNRFACPTCTPFAN